MTTTRILIQVRYIYFYSTPEWNYFPHGTDSSILLYKRREKLIKQNNSISWIELFIQMFLTIKEPVHVGCWSYWCWCISVRGRSVFTCCPAVYTLHLAWVLAIYNKYFYLSISVFAAIFIRPPNINIYGLSV